MTSQSDDKQNAAVGGSVEARGTRQSVSSGVDSKNKIRPAMDMKEREHLTVLFFEFAAHAAEIHRGTGQPAGFFAEFVEFFSALSCTLL